MQVQQLQKVLRCEKCVYVTGPSNLSNAQEALCRWVYKYVMLVGISFKVLIEEHLYLVCMTLRVEVAGWTVNQEIRV